MLQGCHEALIHGLRFLIALALRQRLFLAFLLRSRPHSLEASQLLLWVIQLRVGVAQLLLEDSKT